MHVCCVDYVTFWLAQLVIRAGLLCGGLGVRVPAGPALRVLKMDEDIVLLFFDINKWRAILVLSDNEGRGR